MDQDQLAARLICKLLKSSSAFLLFKFRKQNQPSKNIFVFRERLVHLSNMVDGQAFKAEVDHQVGFDKT